VPTLFTRIIEGEIPGRFVWRDDICVAFLTIEPITAGHTLVVPIAEVDHWIDLDPDTWAHLGEVARTIGRAQDVAFDAVRIGTMVAGFEIPHAHVHVLPIDSEADLHLDRAQTDPDPHDLDDAAERIRGALRDAGHGAHVPD
jgi:diadenosine tetraphosphate (Ap4A) HIT family hydrolase